MPPLLRSLEKESLTFVGETPEKKNLSPCYILLSFFSFIYFFLEEGCAVLTQSANIRFLTDPDVCCFRHQ